MPVATGALDPAVDLSDRSSSSLVALRDHSVNPHERKCGLTVRNLVFRLVLARQITHDVGVHVFDYSYKLCRSAATQV